MCDKCLGKILLSCFCECLRLGRAVAVAVTVVVVVVVAVDCKLTSPVVVSIICRAQFSLLNIVQILT